MPSVAEKHTYKVSGDREKSTHVEGPLHIENKTLPTLGVARTQTTRVNVEFFQGEIVLEAPSVAEVDEAEGITPEQMTKMAQRFASLMPTDLVDVELPDPFSE